MKNLFSLNKTISQQLNGFLPKPGKTNLDWYFFCLFLDEFNNNNLEMGVGFGGSALTMESFSKKLTLVDNWSQTWSLDDCRHYFDDSITSFISCNSHDFKSENAIWDLIHIDAHKDYEGTLLDLKVCEKLNPTVICVDDFLQSMWYDISRAVFDFCKISCYNLTFVGNHQVFLMKNNESKSLKKIITHFPVRVWDDTVFLTYGEYPNNKVLEEFINKASLSYTWFNKDRNGVFYA